jgi:hypothetical protein
LGGGYTKPIGSGCAGLGFFTGEAADDLFDPVPQLSKLAAAATEPP